MRDGSFWRARWSSAANATQEATVISKKGTMRGNGTRKVVEKEERTTDEALGDSGG